MQRRALMVALLTAFVMALLHGYALEYELYWTFRWFDIPLHLMGGFTLGMLALGLFSPFRLNTFVLFVAIGIVGWELFEYVAHFEEAEPYVIDTLQDLANGSLGAACAYFLTHHVWRSR